MSSVLNDVQSAMGVMDCVQGKSHLATASRLIVSLLFVPVLQIFWPTLAFDVVRNAKMRANPPRCCILTNASLQLRVVVSAVPGR